EREIKNGKTHILDLPNFKKYDVPFYSVAWIPQHIIKSRQIETVDDSSNSNHNSTFATKGKLEPEHAIVADNYLVFIGSSGAGCNSIPNALVIAHFDVCNDFELPYKMTLNSNGDDLICGMETPKVCRSFASYLYRIHFSVEILVSNVLDESMQT
ncbi:hypothetical protein CR513_38390, partial [Mucuna pruriens]